MSKKMEKFKINDEVTFYKIGEDFYRIKVNYCSDCNVIKRIEGIEKINEAYLFYMLYWNYRLERFIKKYGIRFSQRTAFNILSEEFVGEPRKFRKKMMEIFGELEKEIADEIDKMEKILIEKYGEDYDSAEKRRQQALDKVFNGGFFLSSKEQCYLMGINCEKDE